MATAARTKPTAIPLGALGVHGVCAPMTIEGAVNSEVFELYVNHLLVPCLRPGTIVVLANGKFYYAPKAIALSEAASAGGRCFLGRGCQAREY